MAAAATIVRMIVVVVAVLAVGMRMSMLVIMLAAVVCAAAVFVMRVCMLRCGEVFSWKSPQRVMQRLGCMLHKVLSMLAG